MTITLFETGPLFGLLPTAPVKVGRTENVPIERLVFTVVFGLKTDFVTATAYIVPLYWVPKLVLEHLVVIDRDWLDMEEMFTGVNRVAFGSGINIDAEEEFVSSQ